MFKKYLPQSVCALADAFLSVQEIRLRVNCPVQIIDNTGSHLLNYTPNTEQMQKIFGAVCSNSVYAMQDEIKNGFITLPGGHRVGICGRCVVQDGIMQTIADVSSLNFRVSRAVQDCALPVYKHVQAKPCNLVFISPPNSGKTTYLRDMCRLYSKHGHAVSVVDERGEVAPFCNGVPVFELGACTDVLQFAPKVQGMMTVLRTMNPVIIATDEIGSSPEGQAIQEIIKCGVSVLTTFHGAGVEDFKDRFHAWNAFEYAVVLNKQKKPEAYVCLNG